jgi:esterase/lipase
MQHPDEIEKLLENSAAVERVTLESSGHIITEDIERDTVFRNISDFIKKHSKGK